MISSHQIVESEEATATKYIFNCFYGQPGKIMFRQLGLHELYEMSHNWRENRLHVIEFARNNIENYQELLIQIDDFESKQNWLFIYPDEEYLKIKQLYIP